MNARLISLVGLFAITALGTHIWTVVIAFQESGVFAGIITLLTPILSQIYWTVNQLGENNFFVIFAVFHLILCIPLMLINRRVKA